MRREIILTEDGSHSVMLSGKNVSYHSKFGAINESIHIFIEAGLRSFSNRDLPITIFEMGFGTGLNVLLTLIESQKINRHIYYETIEKFPLGNDVITCVNYCEQSGRNDLQNVFENIHHCAWDEEINIIPEFILKKINADITVFSTQKKFDLIYYDAFDPVFQPELWTQNIFEKLYQMLNAEGVLVTYCAKGNIRRSLSAAGFIVEKLPGPKGKREITRATKTNRINV